MRRLLKRFAPLTAVALAVVMMGQSPAYANGGPVVGGGVAAGQGTITPGLSTTPTNQTETFDGTVVATLTIASPGDVHVVSGELDCHFYGAGSFATILTSSGNGTLTCHAGMGAHITIPVPPPPLPSAGLNPTVTVTCSGFAYTRVGPVVVESGGCHFDVSSSAGHTYGDAVVRAECAFEPTSPPPGNVTNYRLECVFEVTPL